MSMKDFDWEYYIDKYPDLANAGINTRQKAIVHYKKYGAKEKRFGSKKEEVISKRITSNKKYKKPEKSIDDDTSDESDILYKGFSLNKNKSHSKSFTNSSESNFIIEKLNSIEKLILSLQSEVKYIKKKFASHDDILSKIESIETNSSQSFKNNINLSNNDSKSLILEKSNISKLDNRIQSSEEYELKDNLSEENNNDDESENDSENSNVIVKYSNSDEPIASKETFSNLSYDK